jgi:type II secretory ATPase GspE/PulE/Tfp pilus assembly ATPase PilB-like protein
MNGKKIIGQISVPTPLINEIKKKFQNVPALKEKIKATFSKDTTQILTTILAGSIILRASDIHIEPEEEFTKIRARIDGILQEISTIDQKIYSRLLSRIKVLSGLKLNITDRPQDGRFSILLEKKEIEVRVSSLPSSYGETIVMRLLDPENLIEIEALGLREDFLEVFKREIKKPNGMMIVTGPTGSGKTTTLYAILKRIQRPEIKIITIEDPVEYHLPGISQTQVNPKKGYDFASGLRSIVRQDPDVILVGEIRDGETAKIAIQAALTGHLVLSTLHTNDAAGTVARLVSLGAKPANIGPALNIAIAQRLVRRVCKKCLKMEKISPQTLNKIKKQLKRLPKTIKIPQLTANLKIPQVQGCKDCNFTGYRGRMGIYEAFLVDDEMEKFILTAPSIAALREKAIQKGMVIMRQDGLIKVLKGITTLEEVERVTGE